MMKKSNLSYSEKTVNKLCIYGEITPDQTIVYKDSTGDETELSLDDVFEKFAGTIVRLEITQSVSSETDQLDDIGVDPYE